MPQETQARRTEFSPRRPRQPGLRPRRSRWRAAGEEERTKRWMRPSRNTIRNRHPGLRWCGAAGHGGFRLLSGPGGTGFPALEKLGRALARDSSSPIRASPVSTQHRPGLRSANTSTRCTTAANAHERLPAPATPRNGRTASSANSIRASTFCVCWEVPVQGRLGDTHGFGQANGGYPGGLCRFKGPRDCPRRWVFEGHIRTTALCFLPQNPRG